MSVPVWLLMAALLLVGSGAMSSGHELGKVLGIMLVVPAMVAMAVNSTARIRNVARHAMPALMLVTVVLVMRSVTAIPVAQSEWMPLIVMEFVVWALAMLVWPFEEWLESRRAAREAAEATTA